MPFALKQTKIVRRRNKLTSGRGCITSWEYLADGDVVSAHPSGFVRALYRKGSPHNFILVTDQCDSFCLMCSQPPRQVDDFDRIREHLRLIDLIGPETRETGITGGEPTLFKDDSLRLVEHCKDRLPDTAPPEMCYRSWQLSETERDLTQGHSLLTIIFRRCPCAPVSKAHFIATRWKPALTSESVPP